MKESIKRFLALAPLLLPSLIRENKLVGEEITEDVSILHFNLDEELPITYVMDMLEDDMELSLLYYARATTQNSQCCYFTPPSSRDMYKFYAEADKIGYVQELSVTIYESLDVMESDLEEELNKGKNELNFINSISFQELINKFVMI